MSRKVYIKVLSETDEEGNIRPISVTWEDGRTYSIDKVIDIRRAYAEKTGGTAIRYTVRITGKQTYIFSENGRWFAEGKA